MGVLAHRLQTLDVSARPPIDMSGNFPAHVSAESPSNTSPNPSEVISEVLVNFSNTPFSVQKLHSAGGRGVPEYFVCLESFYFC